MNDICAVIVPARTNPSQVLLMDMYDILKLSKASDFFNISFLDKLQLIKKMNTDTNSDENNCKCAFLPFYIARKINYNDAQYYIREILSKIANPLPEIKGCLYFSKRIVIETSINYNFVIYFTTPIDPTDLIIKNPLWFDKDGLDVFYSINKYYNIGNELDFVLPIREPNVDDVHCEKSQTEYKFTSINPEISDGSHKKVSLLQKIIAESKTDLFIQNYVFADFMINSYPSQVMCYPQFIGFAVARGLYPKRLKKIFNVLSEGSYQYISFERFLYGCICMDLSSEHINAVRIARAKLIFKYYDRNNDNLLSFKELSCMVKRMRKKMGYAENEHEVRQATERIMGIFSEARTSSLIETKTINQADFLRCINYPELWGLTFLLRFAHPYLAKTKPLMERYIDKSEKVHLKTIEEEESLIPYFIREAYSTDDLFKSMLHYSMSYDNMKTLLQRMNAKNKAAIVKFKGMNLLSNFFTQVAYYLSEISFDIYKTEGLFPLRNPIFLSLLMTAIAVVYPALFNQSTEFWNHILAFFTTSVPVLFFTLKNYFDKKKHLLTEMASTSRGIPSFDKSNHWLTQFKMRSARLLEIQKADKDIGDSLQEGKEKEDSKSKMNPNEKDKAKSKAKITKSNENLLGNISDKRNMASNKDSVSLSNEKNKDKFKDSLIEQSNGKDNLPLNENKKKKVTFDDDLNKKDNITSQRNEAVHFKIKDNKQTKSKKKDDLSSQDKLDQQSDKKDSLMKQSKDTDNSKFQGNFWKQAEEKESSQLKEKESIKSKVVLDATVNKKDINKLNGDADNRGKIAKDGVASKSNLEKQADKKSDLFDQKDNFEDKENYNWKASFWNQPSNDKSFNSEDDLSKFNKEKTQDEINCKNNYIKQDNSLKRPNSGEGVNTSEYSDRKLVNESYNYKSFWNQSDNRENSKSTPNNSTENVFKTGKFNDSQKPKSGIVLQENEQLKCTDYACRNTQIVKEKPEELIHHSEQKSNPENNDDNGKCMNYACRNSVTGNASRTQNKYGCKFKGCKKD